MMYEFEKKIMLTEQEYGFLRCFLCKHTVGYAQTNYYFDTEDLAMNKKGVTCRVRSKDGVFRATIKNHNIKKSNCSFEKDISVSDSLDENTFSPLGAVLHGLMITERFILFKNDICEIVLDRNTYLGTTDYELETEYAEGKECDADSYLESIIDILTFANVISDKKEFLCRLKRTKSKSERFFERKAELISDKLTK